MKHRRNQRQFTSVQRRRTQRRASRDPLWFKLLLVALPIGAGSAIFFTGGPPQADAAALSALPGSAPRDRERATFTRCNGGGWNCVIDGDTIRYQGRKIRIADINTPETREARCNTERALGDRATARLIALLNASPFTLEATDRETDQYGRTLRIITRGGQSLGTALVSEGLAENWKGYRRNWC